MIPSRGQEAAAWAGLAGFLLLVGLAVAFYPGGHRFDEKQAGFSFLYNFLCDLFSPRAYNGQPNPGRLYAIAGTYSLAAGLLAFWNALPSIFAPGARQRLLVKLTGTVAMLASFLIATPAHDWCIYLAVPLGLVAFGASLYALEFARERLLSRLGSATLLICLVNYLNFVFRAYPRTLAGLQKLALLSFLAWMAAALLRVTTTHRSFRQRPSC